MNPLFSAWSRYIRLSEKGCGRKSSARARAGRKPKRVVLGVESLEDRTVPTAVAAPTNLVSWWTANNTAADAMGLNNATLTNVTYATGEVGNAFSFNGVNGWAALGDPSSLAFTASFTIEGWIEVNALPSSGGHGTIIFRGDDRPGLDPYSISVDSNGNLIFAVTNQTNVGASVAAPIALGQFVHVAATLDDGTGAMTLYENGAVVAKNVTTVRPFATLDPTQEPGIGIGNSNALDNYNIPFNGLIDELSAYNRALTSGEVVGIYKAGSGGKVISPVSVDAPSVVDGSGGATTPVTFTLTRTGSLSGSLTANWTTADDTAIAGTNYVAASGSVTFADGQATQTVQVTTLDDNTPDPNLDFKLIVTPVGGTSVMGLATIVNDDIGISVNNVTVTEGNLVFGSLGTLVDQAGNGGLNRSTGMAFGPDGNLYVGSLSSNQVLKYGAATGAFLGVFVTAGSGGLNGPAIDGLSFRPDGKLYVASRNTGSVLRYDATTGAFIDTFVAPNSGGLSSVRGMTFGPDGNLYISSGDTNQVFQYNGTTGAFLSVFVPAASGGLSNPRSLTFGPDGNLYVSSSGSNSVLRYNGTTGAFLNTFVSAGSGGLAGPGDLLFTNGSLYVASGASNQVLRYDGTTGAYIEAAVAANSNGLFSPLGLLLDANNNLLVGSNLEIQRYGLASQAAFTVSLITPSASTVTVTYSTADGSALAGTDYVATSGTLTFVPGETTKTVVVPTINDSVAEGDKTFNLKLSNPSGGTITTGQGVGTIHEDNATKFYVVDLNHATYKYQTSGTQQEPFLLSQGNLDSKGIAANAAGTEEWVVDYNKNVYVYTPGGTLLGSWSAGGLPSNASLNGVASDGTNIWLLDATTSKIFYYAGAASRLSGSQIAASSFKLNRSDSGPANIVTDGNSMWVVDNGNGKVFKYTVAGKLLGSWKLDPADIDPFGITIDPNNVSDMWTVDAYTKKVYQYTAAAGRTSGSQSAAATFALAPGDTNPQGIADPSPNMLLASATSSLATNQPFVPASNATASSNVPVIAVLPAMPDRDAVFAILARESLQGAGEPSVGLMGGGTFAPHLGSSVSVASRLLAPAGTIVDQNSHELFAPLTPGTSQEFGSNSNVGGLMDGAFADEESLVSAVATDSFFAGLVDDATKEE
jgi:outer membrane protein assembly factor BamB